MSFVLLLGGCAAAYRCVLDPEANLVKIDIPLEDKLVALAIDYRASGGYGYSGIGRNRLSGGIQWYTDKNKSYYFMCVPPEEPWARKGSDAKGMGCFADRYVFKEVEGEWLLVEDYSVVCTS
jgi:hypothetical protein